VRIHIFLPFLWFIIIGKHKKLKKKELSKRKSQEHIPSTYQGNRKTNRLIFFLLFAFAFLLYGNTLKHDYVLDDDIVTRGNKFVQQGIEGISSLVKKGYYYGFNGDNEGAYRPLVSINFAIEKEFFGNDPHTSHFFNVLFYAISCVLLFMLLNKLFRDGSTQSFPPSGGEGVPARRLSPSPRGGGRGVGLFAFWRAALQNEKDVFAV